MSVNKNTKDIEIIQEDVEEIQEDVEEIEKDIDEIQEDVEEIHGDDLPMKTPKIPKDTNMDIVILLQSMDKKISDLQQEIRKPEAKPLTSTLKQKVTRLLKK